MSEARSLRRAIAKFRGPLPQRITALFLSAALAGIILATKVSPIQFLVDFTNVRSLTGLACLMKSWSETRTTNLICAWLGPEGGFGNRLGLRVGTIHAIRFWPCSASSLSTVTGKCE